MSTPAKPLPTPQTAPGVHPQPFWSLRPQSDRESGDAIVSNFLLHWFPAKVFKPSLDWTYSFWLGTITSALFLLLILSGLPLLFLYVPSVERAYASVKDIEYVVTFGSWIRSVHRLSAHLMVAAVFLHLVRVFLTGAYKNGTGRGQRRQWNWVIGVGMLLSTLFLSFTGYLLPWDQLAYWAVTVGTNIASSIPWVGPTIRELLIGGRSIEQPTLIRFYVLHILVLPGALGGLFVYHMWRVRKDGGLARADREALLREKVEEAPVRSKTYTLLGVARGTAPAIRSMTLEAPGLSVNAVPDLTRRAATAILGTIAAISILLDPREVAARGGRERARHPEPRESALVLPLASGDRHRHHLPPRLVHRERRVPRGRAAARASDRRADPLALARPQSRRGHRGVVREDAAGAEHRIPPALPRGRSLHRHRHLLPRPLLALLLALGDLARDPHEALTWNSGPIRPTPAATGRSSP